MPALVVPAGVGDGTIGGGGGGTGRFGNETGEPQTLQKAALSAMTDPHFGHAAITPPLTLNVHGITD